MLAPSAALCAETLRQAVSATLERFPEVRAAQHRREAARAQVGQARAELLPSLSGAVGAGRERSRNISTRTSPGEDVTLSRREAELTLSQLLFDGGAAGGQVRRFAARAEGAQFGVTGTAEDVAFRASQVFVELRRFRSQSGIARDNISIHEKTLADVTLLADHGRGRRADVVQAQARRALAVASLDQIGGQLAQAESAFRYLVGRPPGELAPAPSFAARLPTLLEQAVAQALAGHPVIKTAEKELEAAQHDRESARARLAVPRLTLETGATRNRDIDGLAGPNHDQFAMLRLRYNFFRGFGDSERVRETEARVDEALAELTRVRIEVERDTRQAWEGLLADRARAATLEQYALASADVVEAYRLQFQLGQRSLLDVLNAENERYTATSNLIAARAQVAIGEMRVLTSMGQLLDALGVAVQEAPKPEPAQGLGRVLESFGIALPTLPAGEGNAPAAAETPHGR